MSLHAGAHAVLSRYSAPPARVTPMTSLVCVFSKPMEDLPEGLHALIHEFRPVHPCAKMIASFLDRIGYNDEEGICFCLTDYKQEPDYFDSRYDGKRGCVRAFYGWGDEWNDARLHGGRG